MMGKTFFSHIVIIIDYAFLTSGGDEVTLGKCLTTHVVLIIDVRNYLNYNSLFDLFKFSANFDEYQWAQFL